MKRVILLIVILGSTLATISQDIIVTLNGDKIKSKIVEITTDQVLYKKYESLEGPTYIAEKSNVLRIDYQNGNSIMFPAYGENQEELSNDTLSYYNDFWGLSIKQNGKKLSTNEIRMVYKNDTEALKLFNSGKTLSTIGSIIGIPSAFILGWELGTSLGGGEINSTTLIVSGVGFTASLILSMTGTNNIKKSIKVYNSKINYSHNKSLNIGLTNNGVGLCLNL